jgi:predicted adenylyl cyclase CyaB
MVFEVEKRSLLENKEEFNRVKDYLDKKAKFLGKKEMKSYLFEDKNGPRIRIIKGKDKILITEKSGSIHDKARKEKNIKLNYKEFQKYLQRISKRGYKKCAEIKTVRYSYESDGVSIELNEISFMGLVIEVELLIEKESEAKDAEPKLNEILSKLGLIELSTAEYEKILNKAILENLRDLREYSFSI